MEKRASSKGHESPAMLAVTAGPVSWDPQQDPLTLSDPTCTLLLLPANPGHNTDNDSHQHPGHPGLRRGDTGTNVVTDEAQRTPGRPHPAHRPMGATPEPRWDQHPAEMNLDQSLHPALHGKPGMAALEPSPAPTVTGQKLEM
ncbi:hypothetical protein AV530_000381 [Patagioenas fasciata monilis]|uniref:Uncharacterized protein n=1 Tax=Patagioenas fasciata monilis TaxID=372326 RepID=A0A1V4JIJ4_PATFA|nr:hypothetical protein AV530_000381 [Patagioenas fasciata monilis]